MRFLVSLLLTIPSLAFSQVSSSTALIEDGLKKYALENGSITYVISGDAEGEELFMFDRYGWRSMRKRTMQFELYGSQRSQTLHEISDGSLSYRIDHTDSTYRKRVDLKWTSQASRATPQQVSESILFGLGGTYKSDSVLLDKTCQVWTFEGKALKEMWIWEGLVLKRISKLGENNIITIASKIELNPIIEESAFDLPAIYQLKE